ncbi:MAG TPA: MTH1187 family thiamine-binding protein [Syntrophorhabdales bacterium]|nr:MTH1187 family thiamine-binding protein [Syntrophorhabdales bacterium]
MSVLMEFSMFPTDKGESVSAYVSRILTFIDGSGVSYRLTPMGTIIETETMEEALRIMSEAYKRLEPDCKRVYVSAKLDVRKGRKSGLTQKIESIEKHAGKKLGSS